MRAARGPRNAARRLSLSLAARTTRFGGFFYVRFLPLSVVRFVRAGLRWSASVRRRAVRNVEATKNPPKRVFLVTQEKPCPW
ncbi:hypothetical protein PUN4_270066 [Paraburkholderia unamae]|nr:hypothetical protein PUN4_270066 [Paraburkholderia unamae]